ncbi:hypothetical protein lerEdw1_014443 [Lerista edwardsae]|nr:hypothetical protein lerEdw1_014443 [Lerista edwardsae]
MGAESGGAGVMPLLDLVADQFGPPGPAAHEWRLPTPSPASRAVDFLISNGGLCAKGQAICGAGLAGENRALKRLLATTESPRPDSVPSTPGYSPPGYPSRAATSRYIASRAVQRSLAIIRQAKQKKEKKKEYCMYYNRFGKCNRGESCPYIHDPEKVAVCTRFLRGTCKRTDGTCPFSHKVSKDKMPVCSYFLKGICNNSDCPYSHVYVSRKAEVCPDFLKGYCPLGEKCKKKHTLVCLDFSKHGVCPKGAQCKLLHPRRKHLAPRPSSSAGTIPHECPAPQRARPADQTFRKETAEEATPGPSSTEQGVTVWRQKVPSHTSKLSKLPSFISLQSPPTSPGEEEERQPARERSGEEAVLSSRNLLGPGPVTQQADPAGSPSRCATAGRLMRQEAAADQAPAVTSPLGAEASPAPQHAAKPLRDSQPLGSPGNYLQGPSGGRQAQACIPGCRGGSRAGLASTVGSSSRAGGSAGVPAVKGGKAEEALALEKRPGRGRVFEKRDLWERPVPGFASRAALGQRLPP